MVEDEPWLLVPADASLIDALAAFGAEAEDRELCLEDEEETDDDTNNDKEDECEGKPEPGAAKTRETFVPAARQRAKPSRLRPIFVRSPDGKMGILRPVV